jgi:hypothetical protein
MNEMYIVSFSSTHHAIRTEKLFQEKNIKCTTLPTPREITASCGISIRFSKEDMENIAQILENDNVEYKGVYHISKTDEGKKEVSKIK